MNAHSCDGSSNNKLRRTHTTLEKELTFLTPGKERETIILRPNGRIIFRNQHGQNTVSHGQWHKWTSEEKTDFLSLTFHHKGSEANSDLKEHLMYKIIRGVYRSNQHYQILLEPEEESEENNPRLSIHIGSTERDSIKHTYLWLHPGRIPAVVLFTKSGQIIFHSKDKQGKVFRSEPNGIYHYVWDPSVDMDMFSTNYHCKNRPTETKTILRRVRTDDPGTEVWRAVGDEKGGLDVKTLKEWHIVMIGITEGKDFFYVSDDIKD